MSMSHLMILVDKFERPFFKGLFLLCCFSLILACNKKKSLKVYSISGETMGTTYNIKVVAQSGNKKVKTLKKVMDRILRDFNKQVSTYDPNSEISKFNNQKQNKKPFKISEDFRTVLITAINIAESSKGKFDFTVGPLVNLWGFGPNGRRIKPPSQKEIDHVKKHVGYKKIKIKNKSLIRENTEIKIDLSAIAKGYGVDLLANYLVDEGYQSFLIEIGGEVYAAGNKPGKRPWILGIERPKISPTPGKELVTTIPLKDKGMASSGNYRNFFTYKGKDYGHTIDPESGVPAENNLASVTVIAKNCMVADGVATALMVLGEKDGPKWIEKMPDIEAFFVVKESADKRSHIIKSSGWDNSLKLSQ